MNDATEQRIAKDNSRNFVLAICDAAITDAQEGIGEYNKRNTGEVLMERLNLRHFRASPRNGDSKYARSIYTAVRFLYETNQEMP
jgi:hypothetical protein